MARWLLKTEPGHYSWAALVRDRRTVWDGVTSNVALRHLRSVRSGDEALVYHTGDERAAVGIATVVSDPYPDAADPRLVVLDVAPLRALPRPVTLAALKADPAFSGFDLVRLPRLSVMPVAAAHWRRILALAGIHA